MSWKSYFITAGLIAGFLSTQKKKKDSPLISFLNIKCSRYRSQSLCVCWTPFIHQGGVLKLLTQFRYKSTSEKLSPAYHCHYCWWRKVSYVFYDHMNKIMKCWNTNSSSKRYHRNWQQVKKGRKVEEQCMSVWKGTRSKWGSERLMPVLYNSAAEGKH